MALSAGTRIGPYEIVSPLGAGGMGEVYRARDSKLQRDVAVKILPDTFVTDPDRVVRFEREARTLAALNHPHIATLYGFEEGRALVLELVEGPTLADRIAAGPLPLDEALVLAGQIADAVEAAHERGIIHRDLKPANIKVRHDGTVKVLDFGLAKLVDAADESGTSGAAMTMSPTLSMPGTHAGVILGTAAYMSPEQARGRGIDRRTDIWAFGCVLFEMVTGRRTFDPGDTISDAVAAVLKSEPDWTALPPSTPPRLRELLKRCLIKDPRRRLRDIGDARVTIEDLIAHPDTEAPAPERSPAPRSAWVVAVPWTLAFLALTATVIVWVLSKRPVDLPVTWLEVNAGITGTLVTGTGPAAVLSPDGKLLVLIATMPGARSQQIFLRHLIGLQAKPMDGTDGARNPFFSPDGQWIAFFADGKLKKVSVQGGSPIELSPAPDDRGGTWLDDHTIAFAPTPRSPVMRVLDSGGTPQPLTTLSKAPEEITHRWPHALPGARGVLFVASTVSNNYENATISLHVMATGERKTVHSGGYAPRYATSGHLLFMHQGRLFAKPFDLSRLEVAEGAVAFMDGVNSTPANGAAQFALSASGTATYLAGSGSAGFALFMSIKGKINPLGLAPSQYLNPAFSPKGATLALEDSAAQYDLLSYDWARNVPTRLTLEPTQDASPTFSPSGLHIAFASQRGDKATFNIYWQNANGTGEAHQLTRSKNPQMPSSWHPNGRYVAFTEFADGTHVRILPLEPNGAGWKATGTATPFAEEPTGGQSQPAFSPDGGWLAYTSTASQRPEVVVRQFPSGDGRQQLSMGGGTHPTWVPGTNDLVFMDPSGQLMAVHYTVRDNVFTRDPARAWASVRLAPVADRLFAIASADQFAYLASPASQTENNRNDVDFVFNFPERLRIVAPRK